MNPTRILIADDDRALLEALKIRFQAEGYEVFTAQDAYQALEYARVNNPQVILLDVNMPAGDGFSVQERLKKMNIGVAVPVIYITGESSRRVDEGASDQGAFAVVRKPFDHQELLVMVRKALDSVSNSTQADAA